MLFIFSKSSLSLNDHKNFANTVLKNHLFRYQQPLYFCNLALLFIKMSYVIIGAMLIMYISVYCVMVICVVIRCACGHNRKIKKEVIAKSVTPPYPLFAMHPQPFSVSIMPTSAPASSYQTKPTPNVETPYPLDLGFHLKDIDEDLSPPRRCSLSTPYPAAYPSTSRAPYSAENSSPCSLDQPPSYNEAVRHIPANRTTSLQ